MYLHIRNQIEMCKWILSALDTNELMPKLCLLHSGLNLIPRSVLAHSLKQQNTLPLYGMFIIKKELY